MIDGKSAIRPAQAVAVSSARRIAAGGRILRGFTIP